METILSINKSKDRNVMCSTPLVFQGCAAVGANDDFIPQL